MQQVPGTVTGTIAVLKKKEGVLFCRLSMEVNVMVKIIKENKDRKLQRALCEDM